MPHIFKNFLLVFLILGLLIILSQLVLGFGFLSKIKKLRSNLFLILLLIISFSFFIFWLKRAEDRYLFICLPALVIVISIGISSVYQLLKKYNKSLALIFLILTLTFGGFYQLTFANQMIEAKSISYLQMKQGFEWIKENTPNEAVILGEGIGPYAIHYAERRYVIWDDYNETFTTPQADYAVLHGFEHQSQEFVNYINSNSSKFFPIHVIFFDQQKQQPAVIIYKIK